MADPRSQRRYREQAHIYLATHPPICGWCGERIDMTLNGNHPWGPTVDHKHPTALGGSFDDQLNWQPMHRKCNTAKGLAPQRQHNTSRDW